MEVITDFYGARLTNPIFAELWTVLSHQNPADRIQPVAKIRSSPFSAQPSNRAVWQNS
jgi:hypothetical protein